MKGFVLFWTKLDRYCHWNRCSLRRRGLEKVYLITPSFKFQINDLPVPVVAIFTKFDDLMNQTYDMYQDDKVNRQTAEKYVEEKFRKPLYAYKFPPLADVCFEGKCW